MSLRQFALVAGGVYVLIGVLGFMPAMSPPLHADTAPLAVDSDYSSLLGLFPVHVLHNFMHLALGIWGVITYAHLMSARLYARSVAIMYGALAFTGLFPEISPTSVLIPLSSVIVCLYALTALAAIYFGFLLPETVIAIHTPEPRVRSGRQEPEERPGAHL